MQDQQWEPPSNDLIREHTAASSNERIDRETQGAIDSAVTSPEHIRARLAELDREWDVDRALMLNFAVIGGLSASLMVRNLLREHKLGGWGAFFITQMGFLAHHAIRRWCPPMPVFRRLGFRSSREINEERNTLERRLERA
jgi:hypothetical protein